mmetsp:Transcript_75952/g.158407  ORF Transcript_75952/g.158407 Transcript_75952/m.158407 type:complete len:289 (-) Transcript_75952:526-1392(-)
MLGRAKTEIVSQATVQLNSGNNHQQRWEMQIIPTSAGVDRYRCHRLTIRPWEVSFPLQHLQLSPMRMPDGLKLPTLSKTWLNASGRRRNTSRGTTRQRLMSGTLWRLGGCQDGNNSSQKMDRFLDRSTIARSWSLSVSSPSRGSRRAHTTGVSTRMSGAIGSTFMVEALSFVDVAREMLTYMVLLSRTTGTCLREHCQAQASRELHHPRRITSSSSIVVVLETTRQCRRFLQCRRIRVHRAAISVMDHMKPTSARISKNHEKSTRMLGHPTTRQKSAPLIQTAMRRPL